MNTKSMLNRIWAYSLPSVLTFLCSLGLSRPFREYVPEQTALYGTFITLFLATTSLVTSLITTVCFVIILAKHGITSPDRWSALAATSLAWASLAIGLKLLS